MRRNRIIWFVLWVLSIVGISFYGGPVSYGVFTLLTLIPIISALYLLLVYILFRIYQKIDKNYLVVNETVAFRFSLVNEYFLLFSGIRVVFFSSFSTITDLDEKTEYELWPNTGIEKETTLICHYRGEYNVGIKKIEIQDVFRLFTISYKNRECATAVVKPQLIKVEGLGKVDLKLSSRDSLTNRDETDVLSHEYVQGDDPRMIDWKQYSRTGTLMVRNRIGRDFEQVSILVDTNRFYDDDLLYIPLENKVLETLLALSYYLSNRNIKANEYHYDGSLKGAIIGGSDKFEEYYDYVSTFSFDDRYTPKALFNEILKDRDFFQSSMVFMVLTSMDSDTLAFLDILERNGLKTLIYYISPEGVKPSIPDNYKCIDLVSMSSKDDLLEVMT